MNTLAQPRVSTVLARLAREADSNDGPILERVRTVATDLGRIDDADDRIASLLDDAFIPVTLDAGRLLYVLARAHGSRCIVEFGTSFGISTIFLAAAAKDNGGRVLTTELHEAKMTRAARHLEEAGLRDVVDMRLGDARETLRDAPYEIDFVFLDGWKALYLTVLEVLEPKLRTGALVVGDDLDIAREAMAGYLAHVRGAGYASVEVPLGDAMEISVRVG